MIKKEMFVCERCGEAFSYESYALQCEEIHEKERLANELLNAGETLEVINDACGFNWKLRDDLKATTKDNCFVISYWQCCDKPAYRITSINGYGTLCLYGCGSWSGYYGNEVDISRLPLAHTKEELFVDKRYTDRVSFS